MPDQTGDGESRARAGEPREWAWLSVAMACVVASPGAAIAAQQSGGGVRAGWYAVQLVVTGLAFVIPQWRQVVARRGEATAEVREIEARADTRATVNDALDPVLRQLASISVERSQEDRDKLIEQVIPFVLEAAAKLIGSERSRSCWFELTEEPRPRLVPVLHAGRSGSPTTTFESGTPAGDAAIGMVLAGENRICVDIDTEPPPGWDATRRRDYRTFISVSVIAGDTAYGMLTLDALHAGDLTTDDLHVLGLMASALAAALAQREPHGGRADGRPVGPDV